MAIIDDIRAERMRKLELLKESGMDPYPIETNRTHDGKAFLASFKNLESSGESVTLGF